MGSAVPLPPIYPSDYARFMDLVDIRGEDDCWPFLGGKVNGYGSFRLGKRKVKAHRVAWVLWSGEDEPDPALQLDHRCHDPKVCKSECPHRKCCNPRHLRPSTPKENVANSNARSRQLAERETCPVGHPWDARNTRRDPRTGTRLCRACQNEQRKARIARKGTRPDFDTHCANGHPWEEGSWRINKQGNRYCRVCPREKRVAAAALAKSTTAA